ncbi:MAG: protein-L-isoaspartate(D-aspartate) O-methyltransferase [Campylobacter lanienae]|uniref:protein-L-isoaspartate(D-aspartate) O-methyltransferase n=1 Tax=Campylobacter lanienae TaxID=75658 RepID=UPI002431CAC9|nr:protein-L-isoaspartate(D-aspartate) O-methyltransferase [Campylobacter lanienae]MCI6988654.1 protein-L-isoaspartate(D-aspartate) O-methyltransferase [Campylobacter sp.]MDD7515050.1 protein-L-isoaspartate(D-aspartate) O-methyltransferase [Campylobacter lanienae]
MDILTQKKCQNLADNIADMVNLSPTVYSAFLGVDRSEFVPIKEYAFELNPQPLASSQWISSPLTVAKMTMALELDGVDKILEIGCGSGYQAAILSKIVRRVFSVERILKLSQDAKKSFEKLNITNIYVRHDDGNYGWKSYAPFERILLSAATPKINERLFNQLEIGGILVAPFVKDGTQFITKFTKFSDNQIQEELLEKCDFIPLLDGKE